MLYTSSAKHFLTIAGFFRSIATLSKNQLCKNQHPPSFPLLHRIKHLTWTQELYCAKFWQHWNIAHYNSNIELLTIKKKKKQENMMPAQFYSQLNQTDHKIKLALQDRKHAHGLCSVSLPQKINICTAIPPYYKQQFATAIDHWSPTSWQTTLCV